MVTVPESNLTTSKTNSRMNSKKSSNEHSKFKTTHSINNENRNNLKINPSRVLNNRHPT